ncbi:MAG: BatD family protein [Sorangiineae bacterium]|nr:BatD family protein [Polyangiaceae bacterium]MEB2323385.1 BatD family protein [Sorangiineae bacterium]
MLASPARAQGTVSLRLRATATHVGVGQPFRVQLDALTSGGGAAPASPRLSVPAGVSARGPSVSSQTQVTIVNGRLEQRQGISATWVLTASRTGTYRIGPAQVRVNGRLEPSDTITVRVDASSGSAPSTPPSPFGFDPFDPFSGMPGMPSLPGFGNPLDNDPDDSDPLANLPPFPDDLRLARAPDDTAFLRAVVTPESAVVGQEVRLRIYAYGHPAPFREANSSEASRTDFLAYSIVDNSYGEQQYRVPIDGDVWYAMKVREVALFPMHAGKLTIGSMTMAFDGRGYAWRGRGQQLTRTSPPIELVVREPPTRGRPAGYRVGDVGSYELGASVEPRSVSAGDSVSVVVKLSGTGNLPYEVKIPAEHGITWLAPTITDDVGPHGRAVGGWRKFSYLVRLDKPGHVALGDVTLPYFDPSKNAYVVARAALGTVEVATRAGAPPPELESRDDPLASLVAPRDALGASARAPLGLADHRWFWLALLAGPLAVLTASGSVRLGRSVGERLRARRSSHETLATRALADAEHATDAAAAASAVERAVFISIEAALDLKARAIVRPELRAALEARGLAPELAGEVESLLDACDAARFTGADVALPGALVPRARELLRALLRATAKSARGDA